MNETMERVGGPLGTSATAQAGNAEINRKIEHARQTGQLDVPWDNLPDWHPLYKFSRQLGAILDKAGYNEMYGIELVAPTEEDKPVAFTTLLILQKFLRANANEVPKAIEQLTEALEWRKQYQPLNSKDEVFDAAKFGGLGYVTELKGVPGSPSEKDVATFNIYGAVKDTKKTFGDLDGFIRWRVALMEMTLESLHLADAKKPIPDFGKGADPYQAIQIHDYLNVSFLRQPAEVKAASRKTIEIFQKVYPETLSKKYFVNVPLFMQWMFGAMQMFMSKETIAKMQWMSYGSELHKSLGDSVPKAYGGSGPDLEGSSETPKYGAATGAATEAATTPAVDDAAAVTTAV